METHLKEKLCENMLNYKRSMRQLIDKYSKLQYQDGGIDVDLDSTTVRTLGRYMTQSKNELSKLESKTLADLREESFIAQDVTTTSQLDVTRQDWGADKTCASTSQFSGEDDGMASSDVTQLTVSPDESERTFFEVDFQPEDEDEELEMTLRSHGSSFGAIYPSIINRIGRAWYWHNVSNAADWVLRKYRRLRQQPNRSDFNNTFIVTQRDDSGSPRKMTGEAQLRENSSSPEEKPVVWIGSEARSLLRETNNLHALGAQHLSPGRERGLPRREHHQPILVMDLSGHLETTKPKEISLNETFTVSEVSQLEERPCTYAASLPRRGHAAPQASTDLSLRSKRLSLSAHSEQAAGWAVYPSEVTAAEEGAEIYARQSPLKARMVMMSRSPHAFSREPTRPRSVSVSLSISPQKPVLPLMIPHPEDSHLSLQLHSPQSVRAEGRLRLRRHLSCDSSPRSSPALYSPEKIDEEFVKIYHRFVCQNKSSLFDGPPCRSCGRSPEPSRGHSSALAALALSPHRSVLRKRHRELNWDGHPQSKRSRDERHTSSPGSKRHVSEMLNRRLSSPGLPRDDSSDSPRKRGLFNKFNTQLQRSADAFEEASTSRGRPVSTQEFYSLGGSVERSTANRFFPRNLW